MELVGDCGKGELCGVAGERDCSQPVAAEPVQVGVILRH
jgi:hypothetical protein